MSRSTRTKKLLKAICENLHASPELSSGAYESVLRGSSLFEAILMDFRYENTEFYRAAADLVKILNSSIHLRGVDDPETEQRIEELTELISRTILNSRDCYKLYSSTHEESSDEYEFERYAYEVAEEIAQTFVDDAVEEL